MRRSACGVVGGSGGRPRVADAVGGAGSGLADDLRDALAADASAAAVGEDLGVGAGRAARAAQSVEVQDERLGELGAHLDLADPGLGLGVGDLKARAVGVVEAQVPDAHVAQLADPYPGASEGGDDRATTQIVVRRLDAEAVEVVGDSGLGEAEGSGDSWAASRR